MTVGRVTFSLDFELGWGHRRTRPAYVEQLREHGEHIREQIAALIDLFERYDIPATWAVVGKLVESGDDPIFHAPELFEYLLDSRPDHEVGLHSFSHEPYDQLSATTARNDLKEGIDALAAWGCHPTSFVFPQNRIAHLNLLDEQGIRCFRGEQEESALSLSNPVTPETFELPDGNAFPMRVPTSMFLATRRPGWYRRWYAHRGLASVTDNQRLVHYWLHPHNVVTDSTLLPELEELLERVRSAADDGEIRLQTLSKLATDSLDSQETET